MSIVEATFQIPQHIARGLANGTYVRWGGTIREANSGQIVTLLREVSKTGESAVSSLMSLTSVGAVASVLNLAVTTMGFIIVLKRLGVIEQQLKQAQEVLQAIDYKIDLSFYANFHAALDLAVNAFTMTNSETRKMSAMQAINRFLEAEHHYTKLTDMEIDNGSQVADEYLSTLCLAYVTEARCYLELEEIDTARRRLQEGAAVLRPRFEKHINTLLTSNPAAYLHPSLKDQVGLKRLAKVYQWLEPGVDESDVFEMQRENLFKIAQYPEEWTSSLPQAIRIPKSGTAASTNVFNDLAKQSIKFIGALPSRSKMKAGSPEAVMPSPETEAYGRLPAMMELMETMVENENRLAMYESEVDVMHQLGMSFQEWRQLAPSSTDAGN
ncbi:MAG: NC domain-containing protein, partial [Bacteroidota bacterium]